MAKHLTKKQVKAIRALMRKKQVNVRQLAKIIDKHENHVHHVLNQRRACGESTAKALSKWSQGRWTVSELMGIK